MNAFPGTRYEMSKSPLCAPGSLQNAVSMLYVCIVCLPSSQEQNQCFMCSIPPKPTDL